MPRLYFDQAATTPLDPRVAAAIRTAAQEFVGNPSSLHTDGRAARSAVEHARAQVAALINAAPEEIVFTASGTEADNFALFGAVAELAPSGVRLVTSAIEHPAVHETCRHLGRQGATVDSLPVDSEGVVQPEFLADALATPAQLVSAMEANNIVGAIEPIQELSTIARERSALFHTDAVQAAGRIPIDVRATPIDLLSHSAHGNGLRSFPRPRCATGYTRAFQYRCGGGPISTTASTARLQSRIHHHTPDQSVQRKIIPCPNRSPSPISPA